MKSKKESEIKSVSNYIDVMMPTCQNNYDTCNMLEVIVHDLEKIYLNINL